MGLSFYMSVGSKHCARLTIPHLVLGTFKLWLSGLTATVTQGIQRKRPSEKSLTWLAGACESIDHVSTDAIIHTRVALTVIHINLTVSPHVTWKIEIQSKLMNNFAVESRFTMFKFYV